MGTACGLLWFTGVSGECIEGEGPCYQMGFMIMLVCCIKFFNSVLFAVLISYSSEALPTVVRSLGYGFTLTFGRMSTFMAPFYVNHMSSQYEHTNAMSFLAPFALLGLYLSYFMPDNSSINQNLID